MFQLRPSDSPHTSGKRLHAGRKRVAGPAPCAGGDCINGPNGTDSLGPFRPHSRPAVPGRLFCGSVSATPTTPISPDCTCPANLYGSKFLKIPAPGTENDNHNPPRIASQNLFSGTHYVTPRAITATIGFHF